VRGTPLLSYVAVLVAGIATGWPGTPRAVAEELPWRVAPVPPAPIAPAAPVIPDWLQAHIGEGEGQIAPVVLQRARGLYLQKLREGAVNNPCYFAKDATRPGGAGRRFYVICEADRTFRAVSSGHGNGRNLSGIANFANEIRCARNFSNAEDSLLTTGGAYLTAEIRTTFRGYFTERGQRLPLMRSFLQFEGEGETANARARAIGGHPAVIVTQACRMKALGDPHADEEGYVPYGKLIDYSAGRSNGCTSWTREEAEWILSLVQERPTTLYIYPQAADIVAVARAVKAGQSPAQAGLYWNASCLKEISYPNFWPRETLEPTLIKLRRPPAPPRPLPICR
jgi:hypothetical protein